MAGERGARTSRLLRGARQHRRGVGLPRPGETALAGDAAAPKPAQSDDLGAFQPDRRSVATPCPHRASLPKRALCRQNPRQEPIAVVPHDGICPGGRP